MRDGGGHLINIASMAALVPVSGLSVYSASKHGVLAFTIALQGELDAEGSSLRLHAVCPDIVGTEMIREESYSAWILASAPKVLEPADVAKRIATLIDGRKMVLAHPRRRGWMMRAMALFPRAALRFLRVMRRRGERKAPRST